MTVQFWDLEAEMLKRSLDCAGGPIRSLDESRAWRSGKYRTARATISEQRNVWICSLADGKRL